MEQEYHGEMDGEAVGSMIPPHTALWPNTMTKFSAECQKMTAVSKGKIWVEIGLSCRSLMPYAKPHELWITYDRRAWVNRFFGRLHGPEVRKTFLSLQDAHRKRKLNPMVMRELARICTNMKDDEDVGVAMFVLWATGAVANTASTFEKGVNCSTIPEDTPVITQRRGIILPFVVPSNFDDEQVMRDVVEDMRMSGVKEYHVNVNWTRAHPNPDRIVMIADSLTKRGISWTFMFTDRSVAKDTAEKYRAAKIGEVIYVAGVLQQ